MAGKFGTNVNLGGGEASLGGPYLPYDVCMPPLVVQGGPGGTVMREWNRMVSL